MKIKDRFIEDQLIYLICLGFGIASSFLFTMASIETYYLKDISFGFLVVIGIFSYIWSLTCIIIGIREIIVVRNNQIIEYILDSQDNDYLIIRSTIDKCRSDIEKLRKEINECKKMKK